MRLPGRWSSFSRHALSSFIVKATHGFYIRLKKTFKSKRFISLSDNWLTLSPARRHHISSVSICFASLFELCRKTSVPQRGELAQARRLPRGTLLAQGPGGWRGWRALRTRATRPGNPASPHSLYSPVWHQHGILHWGVAAEWTGLCWGNAAEKFRLEPTLTPGSLLGGGERTRKI